jgi:ubiquinone/menaquinone biosynthesis C-methylase UbiE
MEQLSLLDVGSSTGYITNIIRKYFVKTVGIDIDEQGVIFSQKNFSNPNLTFLNQDSMNIQLPDQSFDVVNCTQIYEHVPDSKRLMSEIYRVLKPGGICFFAAGNRICFIEPHYKLPFLSIFPKFIAHKYVKLFKKADFYYETHLTYWGLKQLVHDFQIFDYTLKIIADPVKYNATEMIKDGSPMQKIYLLILKMVYWLSPTYIWVLKKNMHE